VGEMMASRWAFEAFMVTQFKDNKFQKQFYPLDKTIAESEYKRVYYIPELESKLAYCLNNHAQWRNERNQPLTSAFALLQNEISNELKLVGEDKFAHMRKLAIGKFDSTVYQQTSNFLTTLKRYYALRISKASDAKEEITQQLTSTPEKAAQFKKAKLLYTNEAVIEAVQNISSAERIVEYNGTLVQKIYPIYHDDHKPKHLFDFSANLYQPTKHFAGVAWDTLTFNIAVIWSMTVFLFITLYFDLLKLFIRRLERNRKYRKRDKD
jgi:hypothetical protein